MKRKWNLCSMLGVEDELEKAADFARPVELYGGLKITVAQVQFEHSNLITSIVHLVYN